MASFVPPELTEEIMRRTDIVELISSYLPLQKKGKNFWGLGPFHQEDTPSFSVAPDQQIFYCFGCQKGGNAIRFIMEMDHLTFPEAAEKLANRCGVTIPKKALSPAQAARHQERQSLLRAYQLAAEFYRRQLQSGSYPVVGAYLQRRGLSAAIVEKFSLGYGPEQEWNLLCQYLVEQGFAPALLEKGGLAAKSAKNGRYYDKFHGRLMFPITDAQGQVIAFGGRVLDEGQPKYLNSPQTPIYNKSQHLYGLSVAASAIRQRDQAVIMEGYMDVVAAHQFGLDHAVAALGTAFGEEQAQLLQRYTKRVLLAYDGDSAGQKAAARSIRVLRQKGFYIQVLTFPADLDPDTFLRQEGAAGWQKRVEQEALEPLSFFLEQAYAQFAGHTAAEKGMIVEQLLPEIAQTPSQVERDSFIRQLAQRLQVSESAIYGDLQKKGLKLAPPVHPVLLGGERKLRAGTAMQIFRLMLEDQAFCQQARACLGEEFPPRPEAQALLALIDQLGAAYTWRPSQLLSYLEAENEEEMQKKEGLRQFLLKLLQLEIPLDDLAAGKEAFLREYQRARQVEALQAQVKALTQGLTGESTDTRAVLQEISRLQRELQQLKAPDQK